MLKSVPITDCLSPIAIGAARFSGNLPSRIPNPTSALIAHCPSPVVHCPSTFNLQPSTVSPFACPA